MVSTRRSKAKGLKGSNASVGEGAFIVEKTCAIEEKVSVDDEKVKKMSFFKRRISYLDYEVDESALKQSPFYGWFNCAWMGLCCFAFVRPMVKYMEEGYFYDLKLFQACYDGIERLALPFAFLFAYAYLAPVLQKIVFRYNLSDTSASILQHSIQSVLFLLVFPFVHLERWPFPQSLSFTTEVMVIFMKMHSYNSGNRNLKESYDKSAIRSTDPSEYPNNLTFSNYTYYLLAPTLVYETAYPRNKSFRTKYFITQIFAGLVIIYSLYVIISEHIQPVLLETIDLDHFPRAIMKLMLPLLSCFLLVFYLVFHVICNAAAEITFFADRHFYSDWWNSTGWDEFSRKWNQPVHKFLFRHCYLRMISKYNFSKEAAGWFTFLFSAFLHEILLWAVFGMLRPLLFFMMMFQIPLIMFMKQFRGQRFANLFFWFGMFLGFPIISVLYSSEYCKVVQCIS